MHICIYVLHVLVSTNRYLWAGEKVTAEHFPEGLRARRTTHANAVSFFSFTSEKKGFDDKTISNRNTFGSTASTSSKSVPWRRKSSPGPISKALFLGLGQKNSKHAKKHAFFKRGPEAAPERPVEVGPARQAAQGRAWPREALFVGNGALLKTGGEFLNNLGNLKKK